MDELRTITRPYAKAVFDLAVSSETLTEWSGFLKECSELLDNNEIKVLIKTPGLTRTKLQKSFMRAPPLGPRAIAQTKNSF